MTKADQEKQLVKIAMVLELNPWSAMGGDEKGLV